MQISAGEAEKASGQFGAAIASKITGVAMTCLADAGWHVRHGDSCGLGIIAGLDTYKLLRTERRAFESLLEVKQRISAELSTAVSTGYELIAMLNGKKGFPQSVTYMVRRMSTASAATAMTAYVFS